MPSTNTQPAPGSPAGESPARTPEQFIEDNLSALKANAQRCLKDVDAHTQLYPHQTLLYALGAGYALQALPTTRILSGVVRVVLELVKPVALIYGVSKLWHATQKNSSDRRTS
ncbi:MAG: hypothetical protein ABIP20_11575 [Chthoniobacteraceae bacterium]